jgi:hypothetical protein
MPENFNASEFEVVIITGASGKTPVAAKVIGNLMVSPDVDHMGKMWSLGHRATGWFIKAGLQYGVALRLAERLDSADWNFATIDEFHARKAKLKPLVKAALKELGVPFYD